MSAPVSGRSLSLAAGITAAFGRVVGQANVNGVVIVVVLGVVVYTAVVVATGVAVVVTGVVVVVVGGGVAHCGTVYFL